MRSIKKVYGEGQRKLQKVSESSFTREKERRKLNHDTRTREGSYEVLE